MLMSALVSAFALVLSLRRWDIAMEYLPEDDSDDEEEDGEGKGGQEAGEEEAGGSGSAGAEGDE